MPGLDAGSAYVNLYAKTDATGFEKFAAEIAKARANAAKGVTVDLEVKQHLDAKAARKYIDDLSNAEKKLKDVRAKAEKPITVAVNVDDRQIRAYELAAERGDLYKGIKKGLKQDIEVGFNKKAADETARQIVAQHKKMQQQINAAPIEENIKVNLNQHDIEAYERNLRRILAKQERARAFIIKMGVDFDQRAFDAMEREIQQKLRAAARKPKVTLAQAQEKIVQDIEFKVDETGINEFEQARRRLQHYEAIRQVLGANFDHRDFLRYEREGAEDRAPTQTPKELKGKLGVEYDPKIINQFAREIDKASEAAIRGGHNVRGLGITFSTLHTIARILPRSLGNATDALTNMAEKAADAGARLGSLGGSIGGRGGGILAAVGAFGAGLTAILGIIAAVSGALLSLGGALTALVSSLTAAVAGLAALGAGLGAALGPLAAIGGAIALRIGKISDAYTALSNEQEKSSDQAKTVANSERNASNAIRDAEQGVADARSSGLRQVQSAEESLAAAQRNVRAAQDGLTEARHRARREVQDLADAVRHAALDEKGAQLTLQEALKRLAEVQTDPEASRLDLREAQLAVQQANEGVRDAATARKRANEDQKRGTDTVRVAQEQLADAQRASARAARDVADAQKAAARANQRAAQQLAAAQPAVAAASRQHAASATTAQEKLNQLDATERHVLRTFQQFAKTFTTTFQPATDAIFEGFDRAFTRLG